MTSPFLPSRYPWIPDRGDGRYANPILHADYSDPDVIRHGSDYFMVASSFNCTPGLPILHSRDLVNWSLINHAIRNVPHPSYAKVRPGCGVWAPSIRFHDGKFWIFFPMPDEGIYVTTAEDPAGDWCQPWCLQEARGWIDPCPFWDEDGNAYLFHAYANSRSGKKDILHIRPMSPDCRSLLGEGKEIIHTPHHPYLEGPKLHKFNGWYYILAPGGGVPQGWQVAFRSRNIYGPYEEKIVLEKGSTPINGPHQGALVDLPSNNEKVPGAEGSWWFLHFQDAGAFGRIVHMQPVRWVDGWPLMGVDYDGNGVGEPVAAWPKPGIESRVPIASAIPETTDEFDSHAMGLQWQWQSNHRPDWTSLTGRPGWLRLQAQPITEEDFVLTGGLLMQKFPARNFSVETLLEIGTGRMEITAGLAVVGGGESASLSVVRIGEDRECRVQINNSTIYSAPLPLQEGSIRLKVEVDERAYSVFSYAHGGGEFIRIEQQFPAKEGGWIGAKVGIYCQSQDSSAHADFDYFRFS